MTKTLTPPNQWKEGHTWPYMLATGETPFILHGRWFLYVRDLRNNDNAVFSFSEDIYYSYADFRSDILGEK